MNLAAARRRSRSFFARPAKSSAVQQPASTSSSKASKPLTTLQEANPRNLPEVWFNQTFPYGKAVPPLGQGPDRPPDERKVKLGKSMSHSYPYSNPPTLSLPP